MSADNGIYIVQFPDGYRVIYASAIDNIDYYPEGSKERKEVLKDYFSKAKVIKTEEEAWEYAKVMYEEHMKNDNYFMLEYGVCKLMGVYENFDE